MADALLIERGVFLSGVTRISFLMLTQSPFNLEIAKVFQYRFRNKGECMCLYVCMSQKNGECFATEKRLSPYILTHLAAYAVMCSKFFCAVHAFVSVKWNVVTVKGVTMIITLEKWWPKMKWMSFRMASKRNSIEKHTQQFWNAHELTRAHSKNGILSIWFNAMDHVAFPFSSPIIIFDSYMTFGYNIFLCACASERVCEWMCARCKSKNHVDSL